VRIRSLLPGLARAEQRVAQVVLADPASVAHRSITEVAEAAGTSETTVTRFCKAIGIGGYPELRLSLAADTARTAARVSRDVGSDIGEGDELADVVAKVAFADARAVEETAEQLDVEVLATVVDALAQARRVNVYGVGASALVALDFQQNLHRIGCTAFAWSDVHLALTSAALLQPGDVAVGISHPGSTSDTLEVLAQARRSGALTVVDCLFTGWPGATTPPRGRRWPPPMTRSAGDGWKSAPTDGAPRGLHSGDRSRAGSGGRVRDALDGLGLTAG